MNKAKGFNYDIPPERRKKLDDLTNEPVARPPGKLRIPVTDAVDPYEGRINQDALVQKRNEYIDKAITEAVAENRDAIEDVRKRFRDGEFDVEVAKSALHSRLQNSIIGNIARAQKKALGDQRGWTARAVEASEFNPEIILTRFMERKDLLKDLLGDIK